MRRLLLASCVLGCFVGPASARHHGDDFDPTPPIFAMISTTRVAGVRPATPTAPSLAGSRIAAIGGRALAIDADSGALLLVDASGAKLASLPIGRDAGVLVYDPVAALAYVADRRADRIFAVRVGDGLSITRSWATAAEPYGVALMPDRKTLLVTAVADRVLAAYDVASGAERWRVALDREPRGVAIASDGSRAIVAHSGSNTFEDVALGTHRVSTHAFDSVNARGGFAAAFMGENQAIVPFQIAVPVGMTGTTESTGRYGGVNFKPPLTSHLAFVGWSGARTTVATATFGQHQPRAVAWDGARDALYIAGFGTDSILQLKNASQVDISAGLGPNIGGADGGKARCGPDGLAVAPDGNLWVWCAFTRSVERLTVVDGKGQLATKYGPRVTGPELVASTLTAQQHEGMVLFHSATPQISEHGAVACANCHLDGRADGLSWRIEGRTLQTPILAGRLVGTAPYKWDGAAPDLAFSMTQTIGRLGGAGITKPQTAALVAYLESMPAVRTPTRDPAAVARGRTLFDSSDLGCRGCHDGARYTDRERHELTGNMKQVDTPSLVGLAASAPYFHDGTAATLEALLRERGAVHGMAASTTLTDAQVADLAAYLETL
jgi:DNA-binding beta-propeller fold protein YncE/cytochrome c553